MPEAENQALPGGTNDSWRTWLMTGARRTHVDRRRMRGAFRGLKKMLIEGMANGDEEPHAWKDFSGAMIRHSVDEAMRSLPPTDKQVVKLAYFGGYSNREIASQVGLTEASVQRRLHRALSAISEYIHHGRQMGRRALYALLIWLTSRSLSDATHQAMQAAAVAAATTIIVTYPVPAASQGAAGVPAPAKQQVRYQPSAATDAVPPLPSPTSVAYSPHEPALAVQVPSLQVPPVNLPVNPPVTLPPVPTPPVSTPTLPTPSLPTPPVPTPPVPTPPLPTPPLPTPPVPTPPLPTPPLPTPPLPTPPVPTPPVPTPPLPTPPVPAP